MSSGGRTIASWLLLIAFVLGLLGPAVLVASSTGSTGTTTGATIGGPDNPVPDCSGMSQTNPTDPWADLY